MFNLTKIAFRNIFRHRLRSFVTLSAITLGGIAIIFVGGYVDNTFHQMREGYIYTDSGHLQIYKKGYLETARSDPYKHLINNPEEVEEWISSLEGVRVATSRLSFSGLLNSNGVSINCLGVGLDLNDQHHFSFYDPRLKMPANMKNGVLWHTGSPPDPASQFESGLGYGLAKKLDIKVGDQIVVLTGTVNGAMNTVDLSASGIFLSASEAVDNYVVRFSLPTAQDLLRTDGVQSIIVLLKNTADTEIKKKQLQDLFAAKGADLEVRTWKELSDFYVKTKMLFDRMVIVFYLIIGIIVILSIYIALGMSVKERTAEIGTLMALGQRPGKILELFLMEGVIMGGLGGVAGVVLGSAVTGTVGAIGIQMPPPPGSMVSWVNCPTVLPGSLFGAFVLSMLTAVLSSILPAYQASRVEIAQALRSAR